MIRRDLATVLLVIVAFATHAAAQNPRCADATIRSRSVGVIHIGMSTDSVRAQCSIVRDTMEEDEDGSHRVVYALVAGDTLGINIDHGSVWTITVRRPRYATADSVRVGMTVAQFILGRRVTSDIGEGKAFLFDQRECGNSFGMSDEAYTLLAGTGESGSDMAPLRRLPASTIIDEIYVMGRSSSSPGLCP